MPSPASTAGRSQPVGARGYQGALALTARLRGALARRCGGRETLGAQQNPRLRCCKFADRVSVAVAQALARCVPLPLGDSTPLAPFTAARVWGLASGLPASGGDRDTRSLGMVRSPTRHRNSADNMVPARPQPPVGHNSMRAVAGRRTRLAVDMDSLHQPADRRNTQVAAVPPEAGRQPPLPCQVPGW
jgi:hypothetical protein